MSQDIKTHERVKEKAKLIRSFLKEKCNADISHSHSLELVAQILGYKDWNTAAADLRPKSIPTSSANPITTVGELKKALHSFDDSAFVESECEIKLKEGDAVTYVLQEFSFSVKKSEDNAAVIKLKLENEDINTIEADGSMWGFSYPVNEED